MYEPDHHLLDEEDAVQMALTKGHKRNGFDRRKSKGSVANHLLNFSLPQRNNDPAPYVRKKKGPPPRTRDEFLHANFRFVISPLSESEPRTLFDPDALTEWDNIEQVIVANEAADIEHRCPICLDTLRAPKITRCGHIYCWPCILTYLSLTENYWRRCPMCFDSVKKTDLRSVFVDRNRTTPSVGDIATFQFIHRSRSSWFPHLPTDPIGKARLPSVHSSNAPFARIVESSLEYLQSMIQSEMTDLHAMAREAESSGDDGMLPVIHEALVYCEKRLGKVVESYSESSIGKPASPVADDELPYTFYQLQNGHYVILHPLCMRALTKEFTDHEFPPELSGKVLEIEHVVMNDEARKRFRFMSHLPSHCDLFLAEIDLTNLVSPATYAHFHPEIKKRARHRHAKRQAQQNTERKKTHSLAMNLMLQMALDSDDHYPYLMQASSMEGSASLVEEDVVPDNTSTTSSPFNSPYASFAEITTNQGYYPALNLNGFEEASWPNVDAPPSLDELKKGGKKTKKGVSLFATSQRRSYR
ncbi:hypothetical protein AeRB84_021573 [Aphanomyces euteiches]|nr:hypothetical protein AeRB84_021573 [Aphanomyces euteiches]